MSKIETFKNEFIEFELFPSSKCHIMYNRKFDSSFEMDSLSNALTDERMSFFLFECHKAACKILEKETYVTLEEIEDKMTSKENGICFYLIMEIDRSKIEELQKKT